MKSKTIVCIVGARPQFIKHAPVIKALLSHFNVITIHTGQHYDHEMSQVFFDELNIPVPEYALNIGSSSHAVQTASMMVEIEKILILEKPNAVLVYGDTNSTLAGALVSSKLGIPLIHIEAGLRSFNKTMPEEINRIVTDHVSDYLFCSSEESRLQLNKENIINHVVVVGDVMVDALLNAPDSNITINSPYILVTLHRPYNVDDENRLNLLLEELNKLNIKIIFPIHPRTKKLLSNKPNGLPVYENIEFIEPQSYGSLINLQKKAECIITDSGGIQKEAYVLRKRCITIRPETEWVETLSGNWNTLVYSNLSELKPALTKPLGSHDWKLFGDGSASKQIADYLYSNLGN